MSDRRLRYFEFFRRDPRRDFDDEMRSHIDLRVADLMRTGFARDDALARAHAEFGDVDAARRGTLDVDQRIIRRQRFSAWLGELLRDVRLAIRSLRHSPAWSATAILCAALGIGATAAVVSASYAILVRALPFADPSRLVAVYDENPGRGYKRVNVSYPDYISWRDGNRTFASLGIWTWSNQTLTGDGTEAERIDGAQVSANLFPTLGVHPDRKSTRLNSSHRT